MRIFLTGHGNLPFREFLSDYYPKILGNLDIATFVVCDFRGCDILCQEALKGLTSDVEVYHIGDHPRYMPDRHHTRVKDWVLVGGFSSDQERDFKAMESCTHVLGVDLNSSESRLSGVGRNLEKARELGKVLL